ncbi:MAG TPA: sugar phosphate isomerase/epimerase [Cyclobacteriaceae bacterium]|nr:sugar phosphate isomerase/epimerase [Cyclobacteriaceae bacterium]
MKNAILLFVLVTPFLFTSCKKQETAQQTFTAPADSMKQWKLGIAFWTFHTFSLPDALAKIDSSGVDYIEGVPFFKAGAELGDSLIGDLSPSGLQKVKDLIQSKGLKMESMYIGGKTKDEWNKNFGIAKFFGVQYVTGEPPLNLWDEVDSLAGVYGLKVAIHDHWKGVSKYWSPDSVLAAIEGHPNFGVCADLGHWPKSGVNPLEAVKKLEGHIMNIHLKDIAAYDNPELKDVRVGTGVVDFPAIFAELKRQNFAGHIYIERDAEMKPSNLPSVMETIGYYYQEIGKLE